MEENSDKGIPNVDKNLVDDWLMKPKPTYSPGLHPYSEACPFDPGLSSLLPSIRVSKIVTPGWIPHIVNSESMHGPSAYYDGDAIVSSCGTQ